MKKLMWQTLPAWCVAGLLISVRAQDNPPGNGDNNNNNNAATPEAATQPGPGDAPPPRPRKSPGRPFRMTSRRQCPPR